MDRAAMQSRRVHRTVLESGARALVLSLALLACGAGAEGMPARDFTDAAGRTVTVPGSPARVYASGPPAAVLLYALKPEAMIGWVRPPSKADLDFLLPSTHHLPQLGQLTGRGGTVNLEALLAARPDLVVDFGAVSPAHIDLADRVTRQTGLPYVLIDGSLGGLPAGIRAMAAVLDVRARGEELATYAEAVLARVDRVLAEVPADARPRVYLARGPEGLETAARGSLNAEILERAGAVNVAAAGSRNLLTPSLEQVIAWAPDTIVTVDPVFAAQVSTRPEWQAVPAVARGRVYLAPSAPFGFIDSPPSVNRLIGLIWLLHVFYPDHMQTGLREDVRSFYRLFWHVEPGEAELDRLLGR